MTKEQEIEMAYAQMKEQERQDKEAAWNQADAERTHD